MQDTSKINSSENFDLKKEFYKYVFYWKYFVLSLVIFFIVAFFFNRFSTKIFESTAKVKIEDINKNSIQLPTAKDLFSNSSINIENELEIITSRPIFEKVISNLKLNIKVSAKNRLGEAISLDSPFEARLRLPAKEILERKKYKLVKTGSEIEIKDYHRNRKIVLNKSYITPIDIPFILKDVDLNKWNKKYYYIDVIPTNLLVSELKKNVKVSQIGRDSEVLMLKHRSTNISFSNILLNNIIDVFNQDGVKDRQLVHQRTIDFVNERYVYLNSELDSIEKNKKEYKLNNKIVDLTTNSSLSLQNSNKLEERAFINQNQIFIVTSLLELIDKLEYELLPANIGIENLEVNSLIGAYN